MIEIHDSAKAFFSSKKGYGPQIEEAAKVIDDAWSEAIRLFRSKTDYSTDHLLNHISGILDQLMRLAVFGPDDRNQIVLFRKPLANRLEAVHKLGVLFKRFASACFPHVQNSRRLRESTTYETTFQHTDANQLIPM